MEWILSIIVYGLMQAIRLSCRIDAIGLENRDQAMQKSAYKSYILVTWHEHLISSGVAHIGKSFLSPIASRSSSGRVIGRALSWFGHKVVYGSQNRDGRDKGGSLARNELLQNLKLGFSSVLTVDGSIGPRRFCKPGAIDLAVKAAAQILPSATVVSRYWQLNTWDKLQIPKPFSKIILSYGPPLDIDSQNLSKNDYLAHQLAAGKAINEAEAMGLHYLKEKYQISIGPDLS